MIASKLRPLRFRGDIATSIHTPGFNCVVSTTRRLFLWRRWDTMIIAGDAAVGDSITPCVRLYYIKGFAREDIYRFHEMTCELIDEMGESGKSLDQAAKRAAHIGFANGGLERVLYNYIKLPGFNRYAYEVLERPKHLGEKKERR